VGWGLIVLGLIAVALFLAFSEGAPVVTVNDEVELSQAPESVERDVFGALGSIRGSTMTSLLPGHVVIVTKSTPAWAVLVGILVLPLGLLLIAFVRNEHVLNVRFLKHGAGTTVQVAGRSRKKVALAVGAAFDRLGRPALDD